MKEGGPRAVLLELLDIVDTLADETADTAEDALELVQVVPVAVLAFEILDDPDTEVFIAGEPVLVAPATTALAAAAAWNAELAINAEAD